MRPGSVVKRTALLVALLIGASGALLWQRLGTGDVPIQAVESGVDSGPAAPVSAVVPLAAPEDPLATPTRVVAVDAATAPSEGRYLRVRARDPSGQAVEGLEVRYRNAVSRTRPSEKSKPKHAPCWELEYGWGGLVHTDDSGHARVHDRHSQAKAVAVGGGDWSYTKVLGPFEAGETLELTVHPLPLAEMVFGRVCRPDGVPRSGADVVFFRRDIHGHPHGGGTVRTGKDGVYRFWNPLLMQEGSLRVTDRRGTYPTILREGILATGKPLELRFAEGRQAAVRVVGPSGESPPKGRCSVWLNRGLSSGGKELGQVNDQQLEWNAAGMPLCVPAMPFRIRVSGVKGTEAWSQDFEPADVEDEIVVVLEAQEVRARSGWVIAGRVTHNGQPVSGASIKDQVPATKANRWFVGTKSGENGTFTFRVADVGPVTLRASDGVWTGVRTFDVPAGGLSGVEIELDLAPAVLRGTLRLPADRAPSDVSLSITGARGLLNPFGDGSFSVEGLPAGSVRVSVVSNQSSGTLDEPGRTYGATHLGYGSPHWAPGQAAHHLTLEPGQVRTLDIDLTGTPTCALEVSVAASLQLSGRRLHKGRVVQCSATLWPEHSGAWSWSHLTPPNQRSGWAAMAAWKEGNRLTIGTWEAGTYRFDASLQLGASEWAKLSGPVTLRPGRETLAMAWDFGSLIVEPCPADVPRVAVRELRLTRLLANGLTLTVTGGEQMKTGEWLYANVPTGTYEVPYGNRGRLTGSVEVRAGERAVYTLPREW